MEKLLVRDHTGQVEVPEAAKEQVRGAFRALNAAQVDRYYRARKVFFISKTQTFEYEESGS